MSSLLTVRDLKVDVLGSSILHGVSFDVPEGGVTALLGRNGVGKSTTLKALLGLMDRTGTVTLDGEQIQNMETHAIIRKGIGYVPEDRDVFASLTVEENLSLAERDANPRYELVHSLFPELLERRKQRAGTLSGGQQQMVSLARALLNANRLMLIDEPTKGLAPRLVADVARSLDKAAEVATVVLVEQNLEVVRHLAAHVVILDTGRVVYEGDASVLDDAAAVQRFLGVGSAA